MNDSTLNLLPKWNEDITRKQYIFNHLWMILIWAGFGAVAGFVSSLMPDISMILFTAFGIGMAICSLVLSLLWMNNRLRDGGVSSEGWRICILIVGVIFGLVGILATIFCVVKPTEQPRELTVEADDDSRD